MSSPNKIKKVAIVGAGGNLGSFITEALLKTGRHEVTAITRESSFPDGVFSRKVDYAKHDSLVEALRGQDALVITLSGYAPYQEIEGNFVRAAGEANVQWIFPNEWGPDTADEDLVRDVPPFQSKVVTRRLIEEIGRSSYVSICTGFWYEWSMGMPAAFGFDFPNRKVTLFDDGETKMSVSTWPQIGLAVAALLSLPVPPSSSGSDACLEHLRNKVVYINSFTVSQTDMVASALRVTGTNESDWIIERESSHQRREDGLKEIQEGKKSGYAKAFLTRVFFPDRSGDFENNKGTLNKTLRLPECDIDEATRLGMERQLTTS